MKIQSSLATILLGTAIAGCGGGGADSSTLPAVTAPFTVLQAPLTATIVEGYPQTFIFGAFRTAAVNGKVYISAMPDSTIFDSTVSATPDSEGNFQIVANVLNSAKAGHYTGNILINVCADQNCASQLPGAPFPVPYDIVVKRMTGKATTYNLSSLSALSGANDWATFQANAAHTGYQPVTLNANAFSTRWRLDTAATNDGIKLVPSSISTGGGRVYTAYSRNGLNAFVAYSEVDGSLIWQSIVPSVLGVSLSPPAYANGKVYGASLQGFISVPSQPEYFAYDATSGTKLFHGGFWSMQGAIVMAPVPFGNFVYTAEAGGGVNSFNATTGAHGYTPQFSTSDGAAPAVDAQGIYSYAKNQLRVIDPVNGNSIATIGTYKSVANDSRVKVAPVIGTGGLVFATDYSDLQNNSITAFAVAAKLVQWSANGAYPGNPAYDDATLFAANNKLGRLEALNEVDGSLMWEWQRPSGESFLSDVLLTKNLVFVSTNVATYAIDRLSHKQVWSHPASGSLSISANGVFYICGADSITAINLH
jgi:hypothetical protein